MDLGLKGRVAFVAAASKGLGRAVAEELAAEGADLFLCARGADALQQTASEIARSSTVRVIPSAGDVSKSGDVSRLVREATEQLGKIDILVTNAGGPPSGKFESLSADNWAEAVDLTLL